MGSAVEVIPGWAAINERLDSTLVQLNRLMHYYADVTPDDGLRDPDPTKKPCVSEECLDTNMQDILREAQLRLQDFTVTMRRLTGEPASADQSEIQMRESNEACERRLADSERQVSLLKRELSHARMEVGNLHKKSKEYEYRTEEVRDNSEANVKLTREVERMRAELLDRTKEYDIGLSLKESAIVELKNELERLRHEDVTGRGRQQEAEKMQMQREVRALKENFQRELMTATQHHMDREMELQKFCQNAKDAHFKTMEDMMALHKEKIEDLKEEHAVKFEECCQNHASLESEWQDKELELQRKISEAVQDKARQIQQLFDEQVKVQDLHEKLVVLQSELANEKSIKSQVEGELKFAKVDLSLMVEKLKMGLKAQEQIQMNFTNLQDEMMNLKCSHASDLTKLEEKALALQKDLSSVTSTCAQSEYELQTQKMKVNGLQKNIEIKQKDLIVATMEMQKLQQVVKFLQSETWSKNEEMKAIKRHHETECQQLQTTILKLNIEEKQKSADVAFQTKEAMEIELLKQSQLHKENVQKLQKQIWMLQEKINKNSSSNFSWGMEGVCRS